MRFSLGLAIAPFSRAAMAEKAFWILGSISPRNPSGNGIRLMSRASPSPLSWKRSSLNRVQLMGTAPCR